MRAHFAIGMLMGAACTAEVRGPTREADATIDAPEQPTRMGFMHGEVVVPDDFNEMGEAEIAALFASDT